MICCELMLLMRLPDLGQANPAWDERVIPKRPQFLSDRF